MYGQSSNHQPEWSSGPDSSPDSSSDNESENEVEEQVVPTKKQKMSDENNSKNPTPLNQPSDSSDVTNDSLPDAVFDKGNNKRSK